MTKDDALRKFYEHNHIDSNKIPSYDRIANLSQKIDEWLANINPSDHHIFLEALSRYTYLTQDECDKRFVALIEMLEEDIKNYGIGLDEVVYVTVESSSGIKSGGDNVRADLQRVNFDKIDNDQIIAVYSKFPAEELSRFKAVVFVDDIIGTGFTIWRTIKDFCKLYLFEKHLFKLYYMCLSPTEKALEHLNENFIEKKYDVIGLYKEGWISSKAYSDESEEYKIIDKYEKIIDEFFNDSKYSYRMGFQRGCLLLSLYYNTPNNTISMFWRPTDFNKPPFKRKGKECKRPGISQLKSKKNKSKDDAYSYAVIRKENEW